MALLLIEVIDKIRSIPPPKDSQGEDRIRWNHTANGDFTVASACRILTNHSPMETKRIWKVIWRRLLIANRRGRMMRTDLNCHRCHRIPEIGLHALRDCPYAASIWIELVQPSAIVVFFGMNLAEWIDFNLSNQIGKSSNYNWRVREYESRKIKTSSHNNNYKEAVKKKLIRGEPENLQNRQQA
ncbi:hypothetical protein Ahy_B02g059302 [Arachis hypogaea]|uniref:Reverse transcriptase zinc-binding domain-containing protein n=1 Tax=Arachis hypogaea TaxID=3818 RepID=A0A445AGD5_ARAHY|nr:hypothetical protein Ahy_B02g059302 [Arachis hypogaea]